MCIENEYLLTIPPEELIEDSSTQKKIKEVQEKAKKLDIPVAKTMWIDTIKSILEWAEKEKRIKKEAEKKVEEICKKMEEDDQELKAFREARKEVTRKLRKLTEELFKKT